jgi:uncharacterized Zn-binding protein involved in type VI secretion
MVNVCRISDKGKGTCTAGGSGSHTITGTLITGAGTVYAEGQAVSRISDIVRGDDSHKEIAKVLEGSPSVFAEGLNVARIGDYFEGPRFKGRLLIGAATVYAE